MGLLTGDNSINGRASVVVMTTEVLRNMMYAGSPDLADVGVVVLDEVHYLQDRARGPVWEEIIIHLDPAIRLVCLSATVANAEEFAAWIEACRGPDHPGAWSGSGRCRWSRVYLLRDRWESGRLRLLPVFEDGERRRPNGRLTAMLPGAGRLPPTLRRPAPDRGLRVPAPGGPAAGDLLHLLARRVRRRRRGHGGPRAPPHHLGGGGRRSAPPPPSTPPTWPRRTWPSWGTAAGWPGSRPGWRRTTPAWCPAFKETVERLFAAGLVKLVFATETLSLGINMPARSVVLESLTKFAGEGHELLQPGDYTQLTGRAGRRGIDRRGTAVVLHSPHLPFERVAAIAAAGSHPLRSSFRPTYNMAANLVASYPQARAEQLLNSSFAQFHEARGDADLAALIREEEQALAVGSGGRRVRARRHLGTGRRDAPLPRRGAERVRRVHRGRGRAGVAGPRRPGAAGGRGPRAREAPAAADHRRGRGPAAAGPGASPAHGGAVAGRLALPEPFQPREPEYRRAVAALLEAWGPAGPPRSAAGAHRPRPTGAAACPDLARAPGRASARRAAGNGGWRPCGAGAGSPGRAWCPACGPSSGCCGAGATPATGA